MAPSPTTPQPPNLSDNQNPNTGDAIASAVGLGLRPAVTRSSTLQPYKTRAASQPAGERFPIPVGPASQPDSGRGSPGGAFGVIGGSRTPRATTAFAAQGQGNGHGHAGLGGIATRANSFSGTDFKQPRNRSSSRALSSHAEEHPSRSQSASPYPTFSPSSTPSASPTSRYNQIPHSPPRAEANASRSRSQSLAGGPRPTATERFVMPMSNLDNAGAFPRSFKEAWSPPEGSSNMSPFTRGMPTLFSPPEPANRFLSNARAPWGSSAPERKQSQLSSSVANALGSGFGQPTYSTIIGGFDPNANGGKSGSSSRRHSVSVVGGFGRRDFFGDGQGMSSITSPPGRGLGPMALSDEDLLPEKLGNALNLEIDQSRKRGVEIEVGRQRGVDIPISTSVPKFDYARGRPDPFGEVVFGSSPSDKASTERGASDERRRLGFDTREAIGGPDTRGRDIPTGPVGPQRGPGPIGSPPNFDPRMFGGYPAYSARPPYPMNNPPAVFRPPGQMSGFYPPQARPPYPPFSPSFQPTYAPQPPPSPSSFSSLSLADLGRGVPLTNLAPNTPLYIVNFKAGRRDVFYCPDPTLLISNGDRVIVEADRGSDLGTVVYDQFTPIDVREWQEKQATAALMSGANQHQPPGMAAMLQHPAPKPRAVGIGGELAGADLHTLLAGAGPGGQVDSSGGMGGSGGGMTARGPLAKEVMPKRIFAKSAQGPEEQARMMEKLKDEYEAMIICREKAAQRGLPMQVIDAEYQWDRRKLTFYFKADKRIDFRDLTKENFRIFKSRIWMEMVPRDDPRGGFE